MQHYTTAPASAAPGLDLFAAAWVERWLHHGGSIIVNPDGTGQSYIPVDPFDVPRYQPPRDDLPEDHKNRQMSWDSANYVGRTRELLDLLELVPGGREAVKAHVRKFPSTTYRGGTAVLA